MFCLKNITLLAVLAAAVWPFGDLQANQICSSALRGSGPRAPGVYGLVPTDWTFRTQFSVLQEKLSGNGWSAVHPYTRNVTGFRSLASYLWTGASARTQGSSAALESLDEKGEFNGAVVVDDSQNQALSSRHLAILALAANAEIDIHETAFGLISQLKEQLKSEKGYITAFLPRSSPWVAVLAQQGFWDQDTYVFQSNETYVHLVWKKTRGNAEDPVSALPFEPDKRLRRVDTLLAL